MTRSTTPLTLMVHFQTLPDPRLERTRLHLLSDILTIAICAIICDADGWTEVEEWGIAKKDWLQTFLALPNGIPSHDTFGRLFSQLNPDNFRRCFTRWAECVSEELEAHIAIDGKTLRRSFDKAADRGAIHMVSAWSCSAQLALAQLRTEEKSNEITAIPTLLDLLSLRGCIVTIDAMGCQKDIAAKIVEKGAEYVLALKGNQPNTLAEVASAFENAERAGWKGTPRGCLTTEDDRHGRMEKRSYTVIAAMHGGVGELAGWPSLGTLVMVDRERETEGKRSTERLFYLSSLPPDVSRHAEVIRGHWSIENNLHWVLDVQFNEDNSRVRKDYAPENLAIMRHMALNMLKQEKSSKVGIKTKRRKCGWDETYLLKVIRV